MVGMPTNSSPSAATKRYLRKDTGSVQKRILVIEDVDGLRKTLSLRLENVGFSVSSESDGEKGLKLAKGSPPDLIILDLLLPGLPGEAICASLREHDDVRIANIPIIMVTAKDSDADRILGKVVGANVYLTKPFEFDSLLKEIELLI